MIVVHPERTHLSITTASACGRAEGHRLGAMMNTLSRLPVWILGQTDWVATTASDLLRFTFLCVRVCASRIFMEERVCWFSVSQPWSEAEWTKSRAFTVLVRECGGCTVDATSIEIFLNKLNGSFIILRFECRLMCRLAAGYFLAWLQACATIVIIPLAVTSYCSFSLPGLTALCSIVYRSMESTQYWDR